MRDTLSAERLQALEAFALELARIAGATILPLFRVENGLEDKGAAKGQGFDPVTAADRGAEAAIRAEVARRFPDHGVIGEEYGEDRPDAEFVWVLDPIDGTRGFIAGTPLWTTLIALRHRGEPVVGVIAQPYLDEYFIGTALGSRLVRSGSEQRLRVRPCPKLTDAILGTTDPVQYFTPAEAAAFAQVRAAAKMTRTGGDAYFFALAALGTMDLVIEGKALKAWDIEAAIPLVTGAGGLITDWRGQPLGRGGGQMVIAGDRAVLDEALVALKRSAV